MQQGSTEMDMDLDVAAAKGMNSKRPAAAAVEDLDDDEERRLEEQLRTKVHKANFGAYPPDISEILHKGRVVKMDKTMSYTPGATPSASSAAAGLFLPVVAAGATSTSIISISISIGLSSLYFFD